MAELMMSDQDTTAAAAKDAVGTDIKEKEEEKAAAGSSGSEPEDLPEKPKFFIPVVLLLAGIALILYAYLSAGRGTASQEPASAPAAPSAPAGIEAADGKEDAGEEAAEEPVSEQGGSEDSAEGTETADVEESEDRQAASETAAEQAVSVREQYAWLTRNEDLFPAHKVEQADGNAGLTDFLYRYGHGESADSHPSPAGLSEKDTADTRMRQYPKDTVQIEVPYLRQWDERWGFYPYGSSVVGLTGCGPTCLSMAAAALAADAGTDNDGSAGTASPDVIAAFAQENGYYMDGTGTRWSLFTEGAEAFGIRCRVIPALLESVQQEIDAGHPVILSMGPGDFTFGGHFILVTGYVSDRLVIHDPNSEKISGRLWRFDAIRPQIINLWTCMPSEADEQGLSSAPGSRK